MLLRGAFKRLRTKKNKPLGKTYFLGIGISQYRHKDFRNLPNAFKDVKDISYLLRQHYQFTEEETTLIKDGEATRKKILATLGQLTRKIKKADALIVYFSGHGYLDDDTNRGFWIPTDAKGGETDEFIRNSTILDYFNDINSHHTLLLSDTCFAGTLLGEGSHRSSVYNFEKYPSRWVFCSGRDDQIVYDGEPGRNSPFAASILKVLTETKTSINVMKLVDKVIKLTDSIYQTPVGGPVQTAGDGGGQFVFRRKLKPEPESKSRPKTKQRTKRKPISKKNKLDAEPVTKPRLEPPIPVIPKEVSIEASKEPIAPLELKVEQNVSCQPLTVIIQEPNRVDTSKPRRKSKKIILYGVSTITVCALFIAIVYWMQQPEKGHFIDRRDNECYETIIINDTIEWMIEDMRLDISLNEGTTIDTIFDNRKVILYSKELANKSVCPMGWSLASHDEWKTFAMYYGVYSVDEKKGILEKDTNTFFKISNHSIQETKMPINLSIAYWILPSQGASYLSNSGDINKPIFAINDTIKEHTNSIALENLMLPCRCVRILGQNDEYNLEDNGN